MSATLFSDRNYELIHLLLEIEEGAIGLPDIQRPFVWKTSKVRDLFDSMYKGFPVGYLLFWDTASVANAKQIGTDGKKRAVPRLLIIDGQQRLTSLYAVLRGQNVLNEDYQEVKIQIAFKPQDGQFEVTDAAIRRSPEYIPNISDLWKSERGHYAFIKEFLENLRQHREINVEEEDVIAKNIDRLYDLQKYKFTGLEIAASVDEEQVSDIFIRINSAGVTLKQADFILTLMSVFWDEGRKALEHFSYSSRHLSEDGIASPFNHFIMPGPDQMLRVSVALGFKRGRLRNTYNVLRGRDIKSGKVSDAKRQAQFRILKEAQAKVLDITTWHEFLKCLLAAGYRDSTMLSSENAVLYAYAIYLIGLHDHDLSKNNLRRLIAKWFFMSTLTSRYANNPEGQVEEDLKQLPKHSDADGFIATLEKMISDQLGEDFWRIALVNNLETSSSLSPSMFAFYASQNLLGAPVLFSDLKISELYDPALATKRKNLEKHHLFPRGHLKSIGIDITKDINQVANMTFLEWGDNTDVSDTPPAHYLPIMQKRFKKDPKEWETMMKMHALPSGWHKMPYDDFLKARRAQMAEIIRKGYKKLK